MSIKSDLSYWLKKHNIQPNKDLGQCFLVSENALNKIVSAAKIKRGDKILEIGGGTGILTKKLLDKGAEVIVVEKDSRLALILHERFDLERKTGRLKIVQADFLSLPFPDTLEKFGWQSGNYKVVANLPYQITSPSIEMVLEREFLPSLVALTIQKEVAQRICAKPGELSSLAVLVQTCAKKHDLIAKFSPASFFPQPEIDSALLLLSAIRYPSKLNIKKLRKIARVGFSQKRKKLKNNLKNVFDKDILERIWRELRLSENIRAQELPVEIWIEIAIHINNKRQITKNK